jgi:hypothetical protein
MLNIQLVYLLHFGLNMQYSFECLVNVLNNQTHCDSVTSSATQTVVGTPMIGHDLFHQVGNDLVTKALSSLPELQSELELYEVYLDNPAGFNYNGERLAMVAQEYVKAFSFDIHNGRQILKADYTSIPTYHNIYKLASLLSFDIKTSFTLGRHGFNPEYLENMMAIFLTPQTLLTLAFEFIKNKSSQIQALFGYFYYSYDTHYPDAQDKFIQKLQRYSRALINEIQFLELCDITSTQNDCLSKLAEYIANQILFYASKPEVSKQINGDCRLYTFYIETDEDIFSLRQDIVDYYQYGKQSKCLKALEPEFVRASSMSWKTYLNGSRFIASIFDNVYLSDFDINDIEITNDTIRIFINSQLSLLESDMIKYTSCCLTLNSYKVEDYVARTGIHEDSVRLKAEYIAIIGPLTDEIKNLKDKYDNSITSTAEYEWYSHQLDMLTKQLQDLKLDPKTVYITDQLIKYYGYCDL